MFNSALETQPGKLHQQNKSVESPWGILSLFTTRFRLRVISLYQSWIHSDLWIHRTLDLLTCLRDTLQNSTDDSSIDKVETSLERQQHFSQFLDTTDAPPCHIHLPVCLWIMDPQAELQRQLRAMEMRSYRKDTTHLMQRPCYQRESLCQDPAGNRTTRSSYHRKEMQNGMGMSPVHQVWPKPSCNGEWKGEEDKTDRKRGGKTIKEWTGLEFTKSPQAVENGEKWRKLVLRSSVVPRRPPG